VHISYILLGGNLGDVGETFKKAIELLQQREVMILGRSSLYHSEPWGMDEGPWFFNQVIKVGVKQTAEKLLEDALHVEQQLGRTRVLKGQKRFESRIIDIDILYFNDAVISLNHLEIPHPRLHLRRFALVPMNELAPNHIHPILNKTQASLLAACTDGSALTKHDGY
jgi:2-amino-4-hydroxy-6-hydroxymethyldihydropteridine diphosphokinase